MKKKLLVLVLLFLIGTVVIACDASKKPTEASGTSFIDSSESSAAASRLSPTSIPTYTPGTELYGMLSVTGAVVVEPKYEYLDLFSDEGLARFEYHGMWGFVNEKGKEVIPAQYDAANNFTEGLAAVKVGGMYGFIDATGKMVIEPQFEKVEGGFKFGRCVISENEKRGIVDQTGRIIMESQYGAIVLACEKYFVVLDSSGKYGIVDRDGKSAVECIYQKIYAVTDRGYFFVSESKSEDFDSMYDLDGDKYYVKKHPQEYLLYTIHSDSLVIISSDVENWGLFNLAEGKYIIDNKCQSLFYTPGNIYAEIYCDGYSKIIDVSTGKVIYDKAYDCVEYQYIIIEDGKGGKGVIDFDGNTILPAEYQQIFCSPVGEFAVYKDNCSYLINSDGKVIQKFSEYVVCDFVDSLNCWLFQDVSQGSDNPDTINGFMSRDGKVLFNDNITFFRKNDDVAAYFPNRINLITVPAIIYAPNPSGNYKFISSSGYTNDSIYASTAWFPNQGVVVVADAERNNGLVSYDGKVLFDLKPCHIFTNKSSYEASNGYHYELYNDTDFLIFTVTVK